MRFGGGGAAYQQRQRKALALHLFCDVDHFIQRWGDQARKPDDIGIHFARGFEDFIRRHHDAKIDYLVVIALQHHADDVFTDVVNITFHRRQHNFPVGLALLFTGVDKWLKPGHRLFHNARGFHHLRQEHFSFAKQIAHHVHARHERPFNHINRARRL